MKGDALVSAFPESQAGLDLVFTTEKKGYAAASIQKEGKELATVAISDLLEDEAGRAKFADAADLIAGHPSLPRGSKGTAILVDGRFQVQVRSQAEGFGEAQRKAVLEKVQFSALPMTR
ncbi:MAG: hypothetical protein AAGJ31_03495 [Verrucomicrobiota bacterium]